MPGSHLQRKVTFRKILQGKFAFLFAILILVFLGRGAVLTYMKERESAKLAQSAKDKLFQLKARQNSLTEKINFLRTSEGIESELRSIYNVAKSGESVVLIIDSKTATTTLPPSKSWWQKIQAFFTTQK